MQHRIELGLLERGAFGHLLPLERAPPVAPPYMGKKLQRGAAARRLCCFTLRLRSRVAFAQAQGPSVPNVQPKRTILSRFGAGSGEENLSARTLDVPNIVRRFGGQTPQNPNCPTSQAS